MTRFAVLAAASVVAFAACSSDTPKHVVPPARTIDLTGTWRPVQIAGYDGPLSATQLYWPEPPDLMFSTTTVSGSDGCNGLRGDYVLRSGGQRFRVTLDPVTAVGCNNVPNGHVLQQSAHARVLGGQVLVFTSRRGSVLGRYRRIGPHSACADSGFPPTAVSLRLVAATTHLLAGTVTATARNGRACTVAVGSIYSAPLNLRPGIYTVTGRSAQFNNGTDVCRAKEPVSFTRPPKGPQGSIPLSEVLVDCQGF